MTNDSVAKLPCATDGCGNLAQHAGLCDKHYRLSRPKGLCQIDGCDRVEHTRRLCGLHYRRLLKHGDVGPAGMVVNANSGWSYNQGYIRVYVPGHPCADAYGQAQQHRVVAWDAGLLTDLSHHVHHKDHDRANNALSNLEVLTPAEHKRLHADESPYDWDRAEALYRSGMSAAQVASVLGAPPRTVSHRLKKRGVPIRNPTDYAQARAQVSDDEIAAALIANGGRCFTVARALGVNRNRVTRVRDARGIPAAPAGRNRPR